ncbi:hypothetical protein [Saccharopolyspora hattusasensis]|uniref:hypothetical protein n=1 Tax=Saccharopolyspora hattusasensis TaxID=1128679 RepID=UPI003D9664CC
MLVIRPPVHRSPRGARSRSGRTRRVGLLVVVDCKSSTCRANWSARSAKGKSLRVWLRQAQHGVERRTDGFPAGLVSLPACTANRSREIACDPASAAWLQRDTTCRMTSSCGRVWAALNRENGEAVIRGEGERVGGDGGDEDVAVAGVS